MPVQPTKDPFGADFYHLKTFPDHVLLDIARNGAAQRDYRLLAVEILQARKSPKIKHPDIQDLVRELEIELDGIVFEHPAPSGPGPLVASVTTETMFSEGPIDNGFTGFDGIETELDLKRRKAHPVEVKFEDYPPRLKAALGISDESFLGVPPDIPPTEPASVPSEPKKPRQPRKPKEPTIDAP
jgi:hypothetical protein